MLADPLRAPDGTTDLPGPIQGRYDSWAGTVHVKQRSTAAECVLAGPERWALGLAQGRQHATVENRIVSRETLNLQPKHKKGTREDPGCPTDYARAPVTVRVITDARAE